MICLILYLTLPKDTGLLHLNEIGYIKDNDACNISIVRHNVALNGEHIMGFIESFRGRETQQSSLFQRLKN